MMIALIRSVHNVLINTGLYWSILINMTLQHMNMHKFWCRMREIKVYLNSFHKHWGNIQWVSQVASLSYSFSVQIPCNPLGRSCWIKRLTLVKEVRGKLSRKLSNIYRDLDIWIKQFLKLINLWKNYGFLFFFFFLFSCLGVDSKGSKLREEKGKCRAHPLVVSSSGNRTSPLQPAPASPPLTLDGAGMIC